MPLHISLRKEAVYTRHRRVKESGVSPIEEFHKVIKTIDPDFTKTIGICRFALEEKSSSYDKTSPNHYYREEIGEGIEQLYS